MEEEILQTPVEFVEVVDIQFRPGQKIYFFDPDGMTFAAGDHVIIDTARGAEFGFVTTGNHVIPMKDVVAPLRKVIRKATAQDEKIAEENPNSTVLVATHATPIRAMEAFVEQKPMWQVPWVSNASYSVLTYEDGVWAFPLVSQDAHLQELKTNFGANV